MSQVAVAGHALNWNVGWSLILAGFLVGALLGLRFHREEFWGGYASFRRRVVRLGHIALEALGMLNLIYAVSPWPRVGSPLGDAASICLAVGGVTMPCICFLTGWRKSARHLFFIPVLALLVGAALVLAGGTR